MKTQTTANIRIRGWLQRNCALDRLHRKKRDAMKKAIECVDELVRDAVWMQRHDPERKLDDAFVILTSVAETASVVVPTDWDRFPSDQSRD